MNTLYVWSPAKLVHIWNTGVHSATVEHLLCMDLYWSVICQFQRKFKETPYITLKNSLMFSEIFYIGKWTVTWKKVYVIRGWLKKVEELCNGKSGYILMLHHAIWLQEKNRVQMCPDECNQLINVRYNVMRMYCLGEEKHCCEHYM